MTQAVALFMAKFRVNGGMNILKNIPKEDFISVKWD